MGRNRDHPDKAKKSCRAGARRAALEHNESHVFNWLQRDDHTAVAMLAVGALLVAHSIFAVRATHGFTAKIRRIMTDAFRGDPDQNGRAFIAGICSVLMGLWFAYLFLATKYR